LRTLWVASLPQTLALAAFSVDENPVAWMTESHEWCTERLVATYGDATAFVERWTVLDCMAQPFLLTRAALSAAKQDHQTEAANTDGAPPWSELAKDDSAESQLPADCLKLLTELVESAQPLWPDPAVTPQVGPNGWCLLPQPAVGMADSGYGQDSIRR